LDSICRKGVSPDLFTEYRWLIKVLPCLGNCGLNAHTIPQISFMFNTINTTTAINEDDVIVKAIADMKDAITCQIGDTRYYLYAEQGIELLTIADGSAREEKYFKSCIYKEPSEELRRKIKEYVAEGLEALKISYEFE